ncbi:VWA domain-containing protein [Candidatus Uhrbacteria bacterium]|jgi:Ca-activated chloride channel homolog|nr:VWA domain-containing protein [Candidatus Uhrbacteria bacterium]
MSLKKIIHMMNERGEGDIEVNDSLKRSVRESLGTQKKSWHKTVPFGALAGAMVVMAFFISIDSSISPQDDWVFDQEEDTDDMMYGALGSTGGAGSAGLGSMMDAFSNFAAPEAVRTSFDAEESIGFAVGGANDIQTFRDNIAEGYLPNPSALTYEGLFYEYFFDTGKQEECSELFCASYVQTASEDPISGEVDHYLSVGLNSGITEADFERLPLNLIVVMDISGSMGSSFSDYYYDQAVLDTWEKDAVDEYYENVIKSKMEVANEAVVDLMGHLNDDDRFGVVLYDDDAYLAKPMKLVSSTDMDSVADHVMEIVDSGGTNMEAGMSMASQMFDDLSGFELEGYENRIIFVTDAMPNAGDTSEDGLLGMVEGNAEKSVYTSFIGVGVDFQTDLIESITKVRGANYYAVHTPVDFRERMDEQFDFMVTPLVFDLSLSFDSENISIAQVYGSPDADRATGELMYVNTLFPSASAGGEVRGGVVLLKLDGAQIGEDIDLTVSYENRYGEEFIQTDSVTIVDGGSDSSGVAKAVLLARYADLLLNWLIDTNQEVSVPAVTADDGIAIPSQWLLGEWEQTSTTLTVSDDYKELFGIFEEYMKDQISVLADEELNQEIDLLQTLQQAAGVSYGDDGLDGDDWLY